MTTEEITVQKMAKAINILKEEYIEYRNAFNTEKKLQKRKENSQRKCDKKIGGSNE